MEVKIELNSNEIKKTAHPKPITKLWRISKEQSEWEKSGREIKFVSISAEVRPLFVNKLEESLGAHDTHHSKAQNWRRSLHSST